MSKVRIGNQHWQHSRLNPRHYNLVARGETALGRDSIKTIIVAPSLATTTCVARSWCPYHKWMQNCKENKKEVKAAFISQIPSLAIRADAARRNCCLRWKNLLDNRQDSRWSIVRCCEKFHREKILWLQVLKRLWWEIGVKSEQSSFLAQHSQSLLATN